MKIIDSHAHIYLEQFDSDRDEMMERSHEAGLGAILMPNIDHTSIDRMLEVENTYPSFTRSMMGLHPCSVKKDFEKELYLVEEWLDKGKFIAVGEIGTDLYWDKTYFEQQKEAFRIQCDLAINHKLPVVIHCRESIDETIKLVEPFAERGLKGVFHCFTGDKEQAAKITALGFKLGIGGVLTFKNSGLDKTVEDLDIADLLIETDSPYLAPAPNRGKRNEPAFTSLVVKKLSLLLNLEMDQVINQTTLNTTTLFNL